ncbi:hypothetical protein T07_674 [Trichinella nelsoni]|uniref:Uncharacterized protein n=1 Tax=Trichinella nelsoni TaxID=6336 RepID=A0A0V0RN85_9BILA|nr:hypothetical protein T07_674 [Trichinella nelsoni]
MPPAFYCTYFPSGGAPGFALRLRPRANKNLHIPSGYASGVMPRGICKFLFALGRSLRAMPGAIFYKFQNFRKIA